ncbi:MAG TPA: hypothetical protein DHU85_03645 [Porphyromonadaceae bacterium]|nr:hypothetical protein [Porphyromonadaceae bacterium]
MLIFVVCNANVGIKNDTCKFLQHFFVAPLTRSQTINPDTKKVRKIFLTSLSISGFDVILWA